MKLSTKTRYGLSVMICLAQNQQPNESITVISLADKLGISKIYLEQVFSLLKRAGLVTSTKGALGGYQLALSPTDINVYTIISSIELDLFKKTAPTVATSAITIETVMQDSIFAPLDNTILDTLSVITLEYLCHECKKHTQDNGYMYYI